MNLACDSDKQKQQTPLSMLREESRIAKQNIAQHFGDAANSYDNAAQLQQRIGTALLEHLFIQAPDFKPDHCLDVGCGTGYLLRQLRQRKQSPRYSIGLDLSHSMLMTAQERLTYSRFIQGDAEKLPLASSSMSLVMSNLAVQWLPTLSHFLSEAYRVLKPGGFLAFSTLGPDTLKELTEQRQLAGLPSSVNQTMSPGTLKQYLDQTHFSICQNERRPFLHVYPDILTLMRGLKAIGAHYLTKPSATGLQGKHALMRLCQQSQARYPDGIPARYDTYLVILQKPETKDH